MFKWLLITLFTLVATSAWAQNPTCPTRPANDDSNACASTAYVQNQIAATGTGIVSTNAVLETTATTTFPNGVWRADFSAGVGAPPVLYLPSASACSLNGGLGDNGSQVPSANSLCWIAQFPTSGADIREWGALCNGTNDTSAIQAALNYGKSLIIPAGKTCDVSTVNLTANVVLKGQGPGATIQRLASASAGNVIYSNSTSGWTLQDFTVDGNATNETAAGTGILVQGSGNFTIKGVSSNNNKLNGTGGYGFQIQDTTDGTNNTFSLMNNVTGIGNQAQSIYLVYTTGTVANLTIDGFYDLGPTGGAPGMTSTFTVGTTNKISNLKLSNFTVNCNAGGLSLDIMGIAFPGYIQSNGSLGPVYAYNIEAVWNAHIAHGQIINCPSYGMLAQIASSTIEDVHTYNSGTWTFTGGFVLNAYQVKFVHNTVDWVGQYGVDAGGCTLCVIADNVITPISAASPPTTSVGLNAGGGLDTIAANNIITPAASSTSLGVEAETYEGDGNNIGFPWAGSGLVLDHNRITCVGVGGCIGIADSDGMAIQLSGNTIFSTTNNLAYVLATNSVQWGAKNWNPSSVQGDADAVTAASTMLIPDDPRTLIMSGTTTVNNIQTYDQNRVGTGVPYLTLTAGGSGYTSVPTVAITGGTCSTTPTAQALVSGNGVVAGLRMLGYGACSAAPTGVSFSGGGGSGATATVQWELTNLLAGRQIVIIPTSGTTTLTQNAGGLGSIFNRSGSSLSAAINNAYIYVNYNSQWTQNQ